jgi:hypothetical protein
LRRLSAWAISVPGKHLSNTPTPTTAADIPCTARSGQLDEARAIFEPIISQLDPFYEATVYAVLREDSTALDTLERAPEAKSDWMYSVVRQPWFRQYHDHPRFIRLLEQLQLQLRPQPFRLLANS